MYRSAPAPRPRALASWLLVVALMVLAMIAVGGITRLTESGLSITEWKPVSGTVPPLTHADWQAAFDAYKATPQYAEVNRGMTLGEFQHIFFWEYVHRLLGRTIGLVLAAVALLFWWRRWIPRGYGARILIILALGGLQGAIGWWMVRSGLQDRTEVSHIRLAIHLLAALLIYAVILWTAFDLRALARSRSARVARPLLAPLVVIGLLAVQIMLGAFTAGLRAGYAFSSWPKMGDAWFPAGVPMVTPAWRNLVDNPIVVQFVHRWFAWVVAIAALWLAARARARFPAGPLLVGLLVAAQILLGIATLVTGVRLPIAVLHQVNAALLLGALVLVAHRLGSVRR